jgi:thioredoxin-like negative regulator of GroEL
MTQKISSRSKRLSISTILLIVGGLILVAVAILVLKPRVDSPATASFPEEQLASALATHQPTFIFLHSLDCIPCKEMMRIVDEVYPEYAGKVVLVDVNVFDERNANLLRQEGLQVIPTLVFYDRGGQRQVYMGVMETRQLRQTLAALAVGE